MINISVVLVLLAQPVHEPSYEPGLIRHKCFHGDFPESQETPFCESKKNGNQLRRRLKSGLSRRFGALPFWHKKINL